ncbi:hypothetical protein WSK_0071 [Novosphingobium sp. Rr 2-17]|uniref:hypothetical protein n=1 Tax=Novosphingobium sp. Rr 2-17 TaxID=555793 RepID=UPI000269AAC6|nr:hypothetical protein [Novosphingobium sp. Rr 2-17]EIZ81364.1 hypothetical protein WSK_0071 [Novosphingobium sp. Rr 2-17]
MLAAASPGLAQEAQEGPEQIEQIEPGSGEWQAEYYGAFGGAGNQSAQLLVGLSGRLMLGAEAEFQGPRDRLLFDSFGPLLLYRAIDPDQHPVGLGLELQASLGRDGAFEGVDARVIVERRAADWWLQGNLILRNAREDGSDGTSLAYAASVQRSLAGETWLGVEVSGQLKRLAGATELAPQGRHYAGPSLSAEVPIGGNPVELGLAWLQRLCGDGAGSGPRIFAQFSF